MSEQEKEAWGEFNPEEQVTIGKDDAKDESEDFEGHQMVGGDARVADPKEQLPEV